VIFLILDFATVHFYLVLFSRRRKLNFIFYLGHGRSIFENSPTWICHCDAIPESPGDFGPRREESQAHHIELCRGHLFTCDAPPNRRINPVLMRFLLVTALLIFSVAVPFIFLFYFKHYQARLQSLLIFQQLPRKSAFHFLYLIGR
jgi:hypothetical protein